MSLLGIIVVLTCELLEIIIPHGIQDDVVRIVTENGRTLKFNNYRFEKE